MSARPGAHQWLWPATLLQVLPLGGGEATMGASVPASIVACNTAYGACQSACAATLLGPTP